MPFPIYSVAADTMGVACVPVLDAELVTAGPYDTNFIGVSITGDVLVVHFDAEPSAANITTVVDTLAAHDVALPVAKQDKIVDIDRRTEELISLGFTYSAKQFSLSLPSQSKMIASHQIKDDPAFTYPANWNSIDDTDVYAIVDAADLDAFYLTAIGTIRAHLDSGTVLKDGVRAAADVAAVDAVVDSR